MDKPILVDTDVMVDFLRGYPKAVALVQTHSTRIILPSIVAAELYAGVKGDAELRTLDSLISLFRVVPVSREIARAGGLYRRDYAKSHGIGLADAIVAATVEAEIADLRTLNTKHYPMFKGLKPAYTKTMDSAVQVAAAKPPCRRVRARHRCGPGSLHLDPVVRANLLSR